MKNRKLKKFWPILVASVFSLSLESGAALARDSRTLEEWIRFQEVQSTRRLLQNIAPTGTALGVVVASPSRRDPNYFYHWVRDAALTMDVVVDFYEASQNPYDKAAFFKLLENYISLSRDLQKTSNPSGNPLESGLGEPKFNVDGSAYFEPWGRPQNDGPALRAISLCRFAEILVREGRQNWVKDHLFDPTGAFERLIGSDLRFVYNTWRDVSFDLWEENLSEHFYTRISQWRALDAGAQLAYLLGDTFLGGRYQSAAQQVFQSLNQFWDSKNKILRVSINYAGGIDYKYSGLDAAVLLGVLHAGKDGGDFSVSDDRVISSLEKLISSFESGYRINRVRVSDQGFEMSAALGRYPEDKYNGLETTSLGNPWFLVTSGQAEFAMRLRQVLKSAGQVHITGLNQDFYRRVTKYRVPLKAGNHFNSGASEFDAILKGLESLARGSFERIKYHSDSTGDLREQFNRDTGFMQGAVDLTWSHAAFLTSLRFY